MSSNRSRRQNKRARSEKRRIKVRGVRRDQVDMGKLSKALVGLAAAEAERQAQAEHAAGVSKGNAPEATEISPDSARPTGGAHE